jgi:hypothetical protein
MSFLYPFRFVSENIIAGCEDSVKCVCFLEEIVMIGGIQTGGWMS